LRIKICGITNVEDCRQAAILGADALGLNFYPASPRHVDWNTADAILCELPPFVEPVGVFVNDPLAEVVQALQGVGRIHTIQWHGDNPPPSDAAPYRLIVAFPVHESESLVRISRYMESCRSLNRLPAAILLDAHAPGQYGGTGRALPWKLLAEFRPGLPIILAGGLTPENVADAIRTVRPYAVDVASGVELSPGRKDAEKIRRFIANAREAAAKWS
jgi:phosphoribosylanthranilate isomerase